MCWFYWSIKPPPKWLWGMFIPCSRAGTTSLVVSETRAGWGVCDISVSFNTPIAQVTPDPARYRQPENRASRPHYALLGGTTGCISQSGARHWKKWVVARLLLPWDTGSGNCADQLPEKTSYLKPLPRRVPFWHLGLWERKKVHHSKC